MLSPAFLFLRFLVFPPANPSNFSHCVYIYISYMCSRVTRRLGKRLFYELSITLPSLNPLFRDY